MKGPIGLMDVVHPVVMASPEFLPNFTVKSSRLLFESDILLSHDQANDILRDLQLNKKDKRGVITNDLRTRWSFPVPYDFDPAFS